MNHANLLGTHPGNATWADKYSPTKISEILGNNEAVSKIVRWLLAWGSRSIPDKKAILLSGPTGTGKTAMIYAIAAELGFDVVEVNASDKRDKDTIRRVVGPSAAAGSLFADAKGRVLLLDEIDGLSGDEDRGGVSAIIAIIKETRNPIVLTANDKWDLKIRPFHALCMNIELKRMHTSTIANGLLRICEREGVKPDLEAIRALASNSYGDLRSAINDLQAVAEGKSEIGLQEVKSLLPRRDRAKGIFEGLREILQAEDFSKATYLVHSLDVDQDMLIQWIYENVPKEFRNPLEITQAFDALSRADIFLGRIRKTQDWGLLPYAYESMSGGVALARKTTPRHFVSYSFPNYIKALSATRSRRSLLKALCLRLGAKCHASSRETLHEFLPLVQMVVENDSMRGPALAKWFELTDEDLELITGGKRTGATKMAKPKPIEAKTAKPKGKLRTVKQAQLF